MPLSDALRSVACMQEYHEELWDSLENDPTLGDDGVAELACEIENRLALLEVRLEEKGKA